MNHGFLIVCAAVIGVAGTTAIAQQAFRPARSGVTFVERYRPDAVKGETQIVGVVIDIEQTPVGKARVRVRNLVSGTIEGAGTSDANGQYAFALIDPSTYVVEMLSADGDVLALSNAGPVGRYETLRTIVQLPGRWDGRRSRVALDHDISRYFGMSANTTMTAATIELAEDQNVTPADEIMPVSPNR